MLHLKAVERVKAAAEGGKDTWVAAPARGTADALWPLRGPGRSLRSVDKVRRRPRAALLWALGVVSGAPAPSSEWATNRARRAAN